MKTDACSVRNGILPVRHHAGAICALSMIILFGLAGCNPSRWNYGYDDQFLEVENHVDCLVWYPWRLEGEDLTFSWSGECVDGMAHGKGIETLRFRRGGAWITEKWEGTLVNGVREGRWYVQSSDGSDGYGYYKDGKISGMFHQTEGAFEGIMTGIQRGIQAVTPALQNMNTAIQLQRQQEAARRTQQEAEYRQAEERLRQQQEAQAQAAAKRDAELQEKYEREYWESREKQEQQWRQSESSQTANDNLQLRQEAQRQAEQQRQYEQQQEAQAQAVAKQAQQARDQQKAARRQAEEQKRRLAEEHRRNTERMLAERQAEDAERRACIDRVTTSRNHCVRFDGLKAGEYEGMKYWEFILHNSCGEHLRVQYQPEKKIIPGAMGFRDIPSRGRSGVIRSHAPFKKLIWQACVDRAAVPRIGSGCSYNVGCEKGGRWRR